MDELVKVLTGDEKLEFWVDGEKVDIEPLSFDAEEYCNLFGNLEKELVGSKMYNIAVAEAISKKRGHLCGVNAVSLTDFAVYFSDGSFAGYTKVYSSYIQLSPFDEAEFSKVRK